MNSNQLPVSGGVAIFIAVIISYFVYSPADLSGVRPNDSRAIEQVHGDQDVQARLWQDPFAAVAIHKHAKEKKTQFIGNVIIGPTGGSSPMMAEIVSRTLKSADQGDSSEAKSHSFSNLIKQIANESRESRKPVNVLVVMVSAGPYPEDEEQRLRRRYAVISGLAASGYQPENSAYIGYVDNLSDAKVRSCEGNHPDDILLPAITPYEWFKNSEDDSYFLLLWLDENAFARKPLCKLNFLVGQITEKATDRLKSLEFIQGSEQPPAPKFKIIGPSSSATLKAMVEELDGKVTSKNIANLAGNVQFFSAMATVQDSKLIPDAGWQDKDSSLDLVANAFKEHDLALFRTIATDGDLAEVLAAELSKRMYDFWYEDKIENFQIALVSEWDTLYGRALPDAFVERAKELMWKKKPDAIDKLWGEYDQPIKISMMGDAAKEGEQASRKWNAVKLFRVAMQEWKQASEKWKVAENYNSKKQFHAAKKKWKQASKKWNAAQDEWKKYPEKWDAANKFSNAKREWERASEKWKVAQNAWNKAPERWKATQNEVDNAPKKWEEAKGKWEEVSATWEEFKHFNKVIKAWDQAAAKWDVKKRAWKQETDKQDAKNKFSIAMEGLDRVSKTWEQAAKEWSRNKAAWEQEHFYRFSYLRGIDGRIAGESKKEKSSDKNAKQQAEPDAMVDRPAGRSQRDYLRRLANDIQLRDQQLKNEGKKGIRAIGILGSDVYDKLMILRVLRQRFPKAIFFTTDLDASLLHPSEFQWTRNMLVASSFDLKIADNQALQKMKEGEGSAANLAEILINATKATIPQFRDVYQTSVYISTLWATNKELDKASTTKNTEIFETIMSYKEAEKKAKTAVIEAEKKAKTAVKEEEKQKAKVATEEAKKKAYKIAAEKQEMAEAKKAEKNAKAAAEKAAKNAAKNAKAVAEKAAMKRVMLEDYRSFNRLFKVNLNPRVYEIGRYGAVELPRKDSLATSPFYPAKPSTISPRSLVMGASCLVLLALLAFIFWRRWLVILPYGDDLSLEAPGRYADWWAIGIAFFALFILLAPFYGPILFIPFYWSYVEVFLGKYPHSLIFIGYLLVAFGYAFLVRRVMQSRPDRVAQSCGGVK